MIWPGMGNIKREPKADGYSQDPRERIMYWQDRIDSAVDSIEYLATKLSEAQAELRNCERRLKREQAALDGEN